MTSQGRQSSKAIHPGALFIQALARRDHSITTAQQLGLGLFVGDGAAGLDVGQSLLDLLFHIHLIHDVIPGGLLGQMLDNLPGGVFGAWHGVVLLSVTVVSC